MTEWFESDQFWLDSEHFLMDSDKWRTATTEIEAIERHCQIKKGARVLDLCCGPGRHSLELARRGYSVTGVDRTQPFLDKIADSAKRENLTIELVRADMREFLRPGYFDLIVNLYSSLTYFSDRKEDRKVLQQVFTSLHPGGLFVFDTVGKEVLARTFTPYRTKEVNGVLLEEHAQIVDDWNAIDVRMIFHRPEGRSERKMKVRCYSAQEFKETLESIGFSVLNVFGDFDGSPYNQLAKRLVTIAIRPPL